MVPGGKGGKGLALGKISGRERGVTQMGDADNEKKKLQGE